MWRPRRLMRLAAQRWFRGRKSCWHLQPPESPVRTETEFLIQTGAVDRTILDLRCHAEGKNQLSHRQPSLRTWNWAQIPHEQPSLISSAPSKLAKKDVDWQTKGVGTSSKFPAQLSSLLGVPAMCAAFRFDRFSSRTSSGGLGTRRAYRRPPV